MNGSNNAGYVSSRTSHFRGCSRLAVLWLVGCLSAGGYLLARPAAHIAPEPVTVTKAIEDVKVGDWVLAKDPSASGPPTAHRVIALPRNWTEHVVHVHADGGGELRATREHPFWVAGKGWTSAKDLRAGDCLLDTTGSRISIASVSIEDTKTDTFNLTVDGTHTFYVLAGDTPVLVHNMPWDGRRPVPSPGGPPPVPPPAGGRWVQDGPQRDGVPTYTSSESLPNGSNSSASWDASGHWDFDTGNGTRFRTDWRGNPISADQAHDPNRPPTPRNGPCP